MKIQQNDKVFLSYHNIWKPSPIFLAWKISLISGQFSWVPHLRDIYSSATHTLGFPAPFPSLISSLGGKRIKPLDFSLTSHHPLQTLAPHTQVCKIILQRRLNPYMGRKDSPDGNVTYWSIALQVGNRRKLCIPSWSITSLSSSRTMRINLLILCA